MLKNTSATLQFPMRSRSVQVPHNVFRQIVVGFFIFMAPVRPNISLSLYLSCAFGVTTFPSFRKADFCGTMNCKVLIHFLLEWWYDGILSQLFLCFGQELQYYAFLEFVIMTSSYHCRRGRIYMHIWSAIILDNYILCNLQIKIQYTLSTQSSHQVENNYRLNKYLI
jgi:hypothetical protein